MATKADFNAEEWSTVVEGPLLAGMLVAGSDRGGRIRESVAIGKVYQAGRQAQGQSPLLDEIVASPPGIDPEGLRGAEDLVAAIKDRLREALGTLTEKGAEEDVEAYKRFVVDVAQAAAEAHKEGGFIGIGGKRISDQEQAALDEITAVLEQS